MTEIERRKNGAKKLRKNVKKMQKISFLIFKSKKGKKTATFFFSNDGEKQFKISSFMTREKRRRRRKRRKRSEVKRRRSYFVDDDVMIGRRDSFFVGFDREVRRYLFHAYSSEIESNGCEILVWSEYGDEKVD